MELVTQNYLNFVFTDPPEDPQFSSSFILSKRRQLHSKEAENHTAASLDSPFPFKQAECVHTCLADDYRFVERHAQHPAAELPAQGAFSVPMFDVKLSDAVGAEPGAQLARRSALDIGPFTFPNLQSKGEKFEAAVMQLRTTVQNFLNLRLRSTLTPFSAVVAISRFGTQLQQRLNGKPVEIQSYGRLQGACVTCCGALTMRIMQGALVTSCRPAFARCSACRCSLQAAQASYPSAASRCLVCSGRRRRRRRL